jgi:serine/threonine-protein kinase HipA
MAVDAGIQMSECRLYEESGRHHFLTKRFDRTDSGAKLHMQSLGAIAHFDFNQAGAYSYEQAADVTRNLGLGQAEVEQLYRRMVLNVMARNNDDHVKNISFLMNQRGVWSLAPAYDVTYAYNPYGAWTGRHQMSVNGKRNAISYDDLLACAGHMSISTRRAKAIVEDVRRAVKRWQSYADKAGLEEAQATGIESVFPDF